LLAFAFCHFAACSQGGIGKLELLLLLNTPGRIGGVKKEYTRLALIYVSTYEPNIQAEGLLFPIFVDSYKYEEKDLSVLPSYNSINLTGSPLVADRS